jgi:hypothetical protein
MQRFEKTLQFSLWLFHLIGAARIINRLTSGRSVFHLHLHTHSTDSQAIDEIIV